MPCRGEISERREVVANVTERKVQLCVRRCPLQIVKAEPLRLADKRCRKAEHSPLKSKTQFCVSIRHSVLTANGGVAQPMVALVGAYFTGLCPAPRQKLSFWTSNYKYSYNDGATVNSRTHSVHFTRKKAHFTKSKAFHLINLSGWI